MQKDVVTGFEQFNKSAMESVKKVSEINMRVFERMAEEQLATATDFLEGGVKQVEMLTGAKDIGAVFKAQSEYAAKMNDKMVAHAKKTAEILTDAKDDYTKLMEEGMKVASDNPFVKQAAKAA
jgi:phasin family protein